MLNDILGQINDLMYTYLLLFLLLGTGLYFSIRSRFAQVRLMKEGFRILTEKAEVEDGKKQVSSFQALMISTASRVGTGNIAGIATAIAAGGPGAVFWMWVMAVIGGASAFIESTLAQVYKTKDGKDFRGGPSYYMEKALGKRWMGVLFSVLLIICFAYGFNGLQSYNMSSALEYYIPGYSESSYPMIVGLILAVGTGLIIFGGVHRIGFITSVMVPIMAGAYLLIGLFTIVTHLPQLPGVLAMILSDCKPTGKKVEGTGNFCIYRHAFDLLGNCNDAASFRCSGRGGRSGWNSVCAESDFCKCGNMGNPLYHGIHFCVCIQQSDR